MAVRAMGVLVSLSVRVRLRLRGHVAWACGVGVWRVAWAVCAWAGLCVCARIVPSGLKVTSILNRICAVWPHDFYWAVVVVELPALQARKEMRAEPEL